MESKLFTIILFLLTTAFVIPVSSQEEPDSLQLLVGTTYSSQNINGWNGGGTIRLHNLLTGESEVILNQEELLPICPSFSPDGRFIVYGLVQPWEDIFKSEMLFGAYLIDLEGNNDGQLFMGNMNGFVPCPQWSPTESLLLVPNAKLTSDELIVGVVDAEKLETVVEESVDVADILQSRPWSPDGRHIGYPILPVDGFSDLVHVFSINMEESIVTHKRILLASRVYDWSADSSHALMGFANEQEMLRLHVVSIDETTIPLSPDDLMEASLTQTTSVEDARWSPNSPWIAFWQASEDYDVSELYVFDTEKQVLRLVTNQMFVDPDPNTLFEWSPNGRYLVYRGNSDYKLYIYDVESDESRILENAAGFPRWSPDGTHLLIAISTEDTSFRKLGEWALYNVAEDTIEREFRYRDEDGRIFYGNILWHPDGQYVLVAHGRVLLDITTGSVFRTGTSGTFLAWRPSPKNP